MGREMEYDSDQLSCKSAVDVWPDSRYVMD